MKLADTVEMMNNEDYKERFRAEYLQVVIRVNGLKNMLDKWDRGELDFTPTCPREIYNIQMECMVNYMTALANRAAMENIDLEVVINEAN